MARCTVEAADAILDEKFPVLDKGFVRLVDYMGSDSRIVQAARVSCGAGTRTVRQDAGLIDYLLRNEHTSPFEQVVFTFHARMPIFVARQWVRHRMARINEISGRYSVMSDDFYMPELSDIAEQSPDNMQGRKLQPIDHDKAETVRQAMGRVCADAYEGYNCLIKGGVARELARAVLPVSLYTEWYWQIDLNNLFRFLKLRLDPHAQREIRAYAVVMKELAGKVCPVAFESFERHLVGGVHFSRTEMDALQRLLNGGESKLSGKDEERFRAKLER